MYIYLWRLDVSKTTPVRFRILFWLPNKVPDWYFKMQHECCCCFIFLTTTTCCRTYFYKLSPCYFQHLHSAYNTVHSGLQTAASYLNPSNYLNSVHSGLQTAASYLNPFNYFNSEPEVEELAQPQPTIVYAQGYPHYYFYPVLPHVVSHAPVQAHVDAPVEAPVLPPVVEPLPSTPLQVQASEIYPAAGPPSLYGPPAQ